MNLIDGIDGLSSGVFIIFCLSMLTLINSIPAINDQYFILITIFLGAIVAFFFINFPPAKIFLGDAGSQLLGWIMAISIVHLSSFFEFNYQKVYLFSFISIPFYDVFYIMLLRFNKGKGLSGRIFSVLNADQNHIHHALLDLGYSHKETTYFIYVGFVFNIILGYFLLGLDINYAISLLALVNFILLMIPFVILKRKK